MIEVLGKFVNSINMSIAFFILEYNQSHVKNPEK